MNCSRGSNWASVSLAVPSGGANQYQGSCVVLTIFRSAQGQTELTNSCVRLAGEVASREGPLHLVLLAWPRKVSIHPDTLKRDSSENFAPSQRVACETPLSHCSNELPSSIEMQRDQGIDAGGATRGNET